MALFPITDYPDRSYVSVPLTMSDPIVSGMVNDADQLAALGPAWDAIEQGFPSPMQGIDWTLACMYAFGHRGVPTVVVDALDGKLRAVAPLFINRSTWPARAEMQGIADLCEPTDLVYADEEGLASLAQQLVDLRLPLLLERLPKDSPTVPALRRAFAGRAVIIERPRPTFPFIPLSPDWEDPPQQLSSRRRSDLRRAWKRATAIGEVACEVLTPKAGELSALFDEVLQIEARSWKGEAGTALLHDPIRTAFYRYYTQAAYRRGTLRLCRLRFGDSTVAVQFAFEEARRFWLMKIGYDEQFARCSPGNLLVCETVRYAARQGLKSYEFLGSSDNWTRVWTRDERPTTCLLIYPYNATGLAALGRQILTVIKKRWSRGRT